MQKIKIVTDSASDIPVELAREFDICILPVLITYGDTTIREFYDITPEEYWDLLLNLDEIPKTSQIQIEAYINCFKTAFKDGYTHLLYIALNGNGSGTYNTSLIAKEMFYAEYGTDLTIEIIDSQTYSFLYGSVAIACSYKVNKGEKFEDIILYANEKLKTACAYLGVYDLKYLKKSGRISGGAAFLGEALGLRPISKVFNGGVNVCDKVRGDANVLKKIISNVKSSVKDPENQTAYILHGICDENVILDLEQALLNELSFKNVYIGKLGAAITTNAGPKSIAVFYHI